MAPALHDFLNRIERIRSLLGIAIVMFELSCCETGTWLPIEYWHLSRARSLRLRVLDLLRVAMPRVVLRVL